MRVPQSFRMDGGDPATPERPGGAPVLASPTFAPSPQDPVLSQQLSGYLTGIVSAVNALREDQAALTGRLVGVEAAQRTLTEGANSAVRELVQHARQEFLVQGQALATLRGQAQQEVAALREYAAETRSAIEALHAASSSELQALHGSLRAVQAQIQGLEQRLRDAVSAITAASSAGPPPTSSWTSWSAPPPPPPTSSWTSWSAPPPAQDPSWRQSAGWTSSWASGQQSPWSQQPASREASAGTWHGGAAATRGSWGGASTPHHGCA